MREKKSPMSNFIIDVPVPSMGATVSELTIIKIVVALCSGQGTFWVDDMSLRFDGKEVLKNASFEGR